MSKDTVTVSFKCKKCGSKLRWPDDAIDNTKISCKCGEYAGTYRDLREAAMKATKAQVEAMLKKTFKGL